ncbi:hypothetical protein Gotur_033312 [Gossypium turneri]
MFLIIVTEQEFPKRNKVITRVPGSEIPEWFDFKSSGSSINIQLPSEGYCNSSKNFPPFVVSTVFTFQDYSDDSFRYFPVLIPCLAVGFLPLPSDSIRVGQLVTMKWRVERLTDIEEKRVPQNNDKMLYEINANSDKWMIAGRKRGHVSLDMKQGSRIVISILCMPLVAGYIHSPHLGLPGIDEVSISCSPAGCHLVRVLPPAPSSSFCVPA